jgi:hypothetical protein
MEKLLLKQSKKGQHATSLPAVGTSTPSIPSSHPLHLSHAPKTDEGLDSTDGEESDPRSTRGDDDIDFDHLPAFSYHLATVGLNNSRGLTHNEKEAIEICEVDDQGNTIEGSIFPVPPAALDVTSASNEVSVPVIRSLEAEQRYGLTVWELHANGDETRLCDGNEEALISVA